MGPRPKPCLRTLSALKNPLSFLDFIHKAVTTLADSKSIVLTDMGNIVIRDLGH